MVVAVVVVPVGGCAGGGGDRLISDEMSLRYRVGKFHCYSIGKN